MAITQQTQMDEPQANTTDAKVKLGSQVRFVVREYTTENDPLREKINDHGHGERVGLTAADLQRLVAIVDPVTFDGAVAQTQRQRIINAAREAGVIPN